MIACHAGQYAPALNLTEVQNGTLNVGPAKANLTVRGVANCSVNNQYLLKVRSRAFSSAHSSIASKQCEHWHAVQYASSLTLFFNHVFNGNVAALCTSIAGPRHVLQYTYVLHYVLQPYYVAAGQSVSNQCLALGCSADFVARV